MKNENEEITNKEKPHFSLKNGYIWRTIFFVVVCAFFLWLFFAVQDFLLGQEHQFGNITFKPYGYKRISVFHQQLDSIQVSGKNFDIHINKLSFKLSRKDSLFFKIQAQQIKTKIIPDFTNADSSQTDILKFPNIILPVKIGFLIDSSETSILKKDSLNESPVVIKTKSVSLYNKEKKALVLQIKNINTMGFPKATIQTDASWNDSILQIQLRTFTNKDTLTIQTNSKRNDLLDSEIETTLHVQSLKTFLKEYPKEAPHPSDIKIRAKAKVNAGTQEISYRADLKTNFSPHYPLPALQTHLQISGNLNFIDFIIEATTKENGKIYLKGRANKNLDGELSGFVENISAPFGPEIQPMDAKIHYLKKTRNQLKTKITTKSGSVVSGTIDLTPNFHIDFTGDISPTETWAVKWTHGELQFGNTRPQVYGAYDFKKGEMTALVKIGKVPYVYFMEADSLETRLALNLREITFSDGIIYGAKETFRFTGEVVWDKEKEMQTSWYVESENGAKANAKIALDSISVFANAEDVLFSTIPFAKNLRPEWADAKISGFYYHNIETDSAYAKFETNAKLQMYNTQGNFEITKKQDTVFVSRANLTHDKNKIDANATFVLSDKNKTTAFLPFEVLNAWVSTRSFSIPLSLLPLGDSTLTDGDFSGDLTFTNAHGLHGNIDFQNIVFRKIPKELFAIKRMNLFAERSKAELDAYLEIGNGAWNGHTQLTFDRILGDQKYFSFAHISQNGGSVTGNGFLDSLLHAKIKVNGYWILPEGLGEIQKSDLLVELDWNLKRGLNGIKANFSADSIVYSPLIMHFPLPVSVKGHIQDKTIFVTKAISTNQNQDSLQAELSYSLEKMQLENLNFSTSLYRIQYGAHQAKLENIKGSLSESNKDIIIHANIPFLNYNYNSNKYGNFTLNTHGNLSYRIPKRKNFSIREINHLEGNLYVDKLIYRNDMDINLTPKGVGRILNSLQTALTNLRRKNETQNKSISKSNQTELDIHIENSQQDTVALAAVFASFPLSIDLNIQGTTAKPTLQGEIANAGDGFIGFKDLYEFNLSSFLISFPNVPWQQGTLDITATQDLPYCTPPDESMQNSTCPINIDILGHITNPQINPYSYCGTESSTASIYYNIFLGCIAENPTNDNIDWNKLAGTAIGKVLSNTANKTLGGNYIGNIEMKMQLFSNTEPLEEDSNYVKIPISLDKVLNNLSIILGYTQDQSENPTYEQAFEFGVNYKLPVFKEKEYSHSDHLNPELSFGAMLVSKQYHANSNTQDNENRLERNLGFQYTYKFWSPCLFGIGECLDYSEIKNEEQNEK